MKTATLKQSAKILSLFEDTPLEQVQDLLESGILADLRDANVSKINRDEFRRLIGLKPFIADTIIQIDRSQPFDPAEFLGAGWSIWRGPADGDGLSGDEDQDERSLALTEVDLSKIRFETCLQKGEASITGEEKLRRLKVSGHIRLDAKIFQTLWENRDKIPEAWKEKINSNTRFIFFDGTILRSPRGNRFVLYFCRRDGEWHWSYRWLECDWSASGPSAVLAS